MGCVGAGPKSLSCRLTEAALHFELHPSGPLERSTRLGTDPEARYWLALRSISGVGDVACRRLGEALGSAEAVFYAPPAELVRAGVTRRAAREIRAFAGWAEVDRELERARELEVDLICLGEKRYPIGLSFTHDPPPVLYVRGSLGPGDVEAIAVVGARAASAYGLATAERLARELAGAGVTVVSGLAIGIDAAAHRGALGAGGRSIAVLGSGIDRIYPWRHRRLADQVADCGALVSELPIGTAPEAHHFPRRNRIVSGLSLGTVVVEASERSGSLITARLALEQGREVLAVPGEAGLDRTRGTHALIRRGARLAESGAHVLEDVMPWKLPAAPDADAKRTEPPSAVASRVLAAFENATEHVDRLIERSGLGAARVLEVLLELELDGRVKQYPGKRFVRR
jgi:DNA processing protein